MLSAAAFGHRGLLWLAFVVSLIALGGLTIVVGGGPSDLEIVIAREAPADGVVAVASGLVSTIGGVVIWWAIILAVAAILAAHGRRTAIELVALAAFAEGTNLAFKAVVARGRPIGAAAQDLVVNAGFPSGHVTRVAVVLGACLVLVPVARRHPKLSTLGATVLVVAMQIARVVAGAHYVTDVLGGVLLATSLLAGWAFVRTRVAGGIRG